MIPGFDGNELQSAARAAELDHKALPAAATTPALAVAGAAALLALWVVFAQPLNDDVAWILDISAAALDGARLYVDIIEINPPLIIWLGMPVIVLERITGISHIILYPAVIAATAFASAIATYRLSRPVLPDSARAVMPVALAFAFFVIPLWGWGQREHVLLLLTAPYVVAGAARVRGHRPRRSWVIGLAAGIGFALKPHFVPALLILEGWAWAQRRTVWPGTLMAAGVIGVYGMLIIVDGAYLPMVWSLRHAYAAYIAVPRLALLTDPRTVFGLIALVLLLARGPGQEMRTAFAITTVAWIAALLVQAKGFAYHFIPIAGSAVLLCAATAVVYITTLRRAIVAAAGAAMVVANMAAGVASTRDSRWAPIRELQSMVQDSRAVMLTTLLPEAWPHMSYANAEWTAPVPSLWPFLAPEPDVPLAAGWMVRALVDDPAVLVPIRPAFDALPRLLTDPEFARAWTGYTEVRRGEYYRLYERQTQ
jgi:hypothetical protein